MTEGKGEIVIYDELDGRPHITMMIEELKQLFGGQIYTKEL